MYRSILGLRMVGNPVRIGLGLRVAQSHRHLERSVIASVYQGHFRAQLGNTRYGTQSTKPQTSRVQRSLYATILCITSGLAGYFLPTQLGAEPSGISLVSKALGLSKSHLDDYFTNPKFGSPKDFDAAIRELKEVFPAGDKVTTDAEDLHDHGFSVNDYLPGVLHSVVVYPEATEDVVKIVKIANRYRMPIIPYSGGTSLEGHTRGHKTGGICVDMSRMDKILQINEADSDLVCQSGVRWMDINETLRKKGIKLFFPLDPAPGATIGGMVGTGCSGTNAVRYGTAKAEWFLNLTVVLPNGEVIKTRRRARKSSAGFDTTKLFIGAEGTLGIVTEATIRLTPRLPTTVAVVHFPSVREATEASRKIMLEGVGIQCIELCDSEFMRSTNLYGSSRPPPSSPLSSTLSFFSLSPRSTPKWPELDSLFFKFQGPTQRSLAETASIARTISEQHGGTGFTLARDEKEADMLWADRKNALYSGLMLVQNDDGSAGGKGWSTDVCVPASKLPQLVYETKKDLQDSGILSTIVGHIGDGNFHALLLFKNEEELVPVRAAVHRMVERAIALDGTCTGEHGVGLGKKEYLYDELGQGTVELMKTIKKTLDPLGIMNPGKLYPDGPGVEQNDHR